MAACVAPCSSNTYIYPSMLFNQSKLCVLDIDIYIRVSELLT